MTQPEIGFELREKVLALEQSILSRHPTMSSLLQQIHRTLQLQPENVTLMGEEDIAILVKGLQLQTGVQLAEAAVSKPKSNKSLASRIAALGDEL